MSASETLSGVLGLWLKAEAHPNASMNITLQSMVGVILVAACSL